MNTETFRELLNFETHLKIGQLAELRWTNNGGYYRAQARLSKVNKRTARGILIEQAQREDYAAGREIWVERYGSPRWSLNNGVFPVKS